MSFELWYLPYVGYLLWILGLMAYFMLASTKNPLRIITQFKDNWIGMIFAFWMMSALVTAALVWPLLILGPFFIAWLGAPVEAGIIAATFAIISFYLSMKVMTARRTTFEISPLRL
jgi:hypothetical protein